MTQLPHRRALRLLAIPMALIVFGGVAFAATAPAQDNGFRLTGNWATLFATIVTCMIATLGAIYKFHRDRKADAAAAANAATTASREIHEAICDVRDDHNARLLAVEKKSIDFLARDEIEARILHLANNRKEVESGLQNKIETHDRALAELRSNVSRIEQHQADQGDGIKRIESDLKSFMNSIDGRLNQITNILLATPR